MDSAASIPDYESRYLDLKVNVDVGGYVTAFRNLMNLDEKELRHRARTGYVALFDGAMPEIVELNGRSRCPSIATRRL